MTKLFPSDEWIKAAMEETNRSQAYQQAAKSWEGDIIFVVTAVPGGRGPVKLYMDLWHGECRSAHEVTSAGQTAAYTIAAPYGVWRKILEGQLDPIRAIVSRQLKLQGNMGQILKAPRAAIELVNACAAVDTAWSG